MNVLLIDGSSKGERSDARKIALRPRVNARLRFLRGMIE